MAVWLACICSSALIPQYFGRLTVEGNFNGRSCVHLRGYSDLGSQAPADLFAEEQPQSAGVLVPAPVGACIAPLEDAGQILGRNADSRIADAECPRILHKDADRALTGIFQSIGEVSAVGS